MERGSWAATPTQHSDCGCDVKSSFRLLPSWSSHHDWHCSSSVTRQILSLLSFFGQGILLQQLPIQEVYHNGRPEVNNSYSYLFAMPFLVNTSSLLLLHELMMTFTLNPDLFLNSGHGRRHKKERSIRKANNNQNALKSSIFTYWPEFAILLL